MAETEWREVTCPYCVQSVEVGIKLREFPMSKIIKCDNDGCGKDFLLKCDLEPKTGKMDESMQRFSDEQLRKLEATRKSLGLGGGRFEVHGLVPGGVLMISEDGNGVTVHRERSVLLPEVIKQLGFGSLVQRPPAMDIDKPSEDRTTLENMFAKAWTPDGWAKGLGDDS